MPGQQRAIWLPVPPIDRRSGSPPGRQAISPAEASVNTERNSATRCTISRQRPMPTATFRSRSSTPFADARSMARRTRRPQEGLDRFLKADPLAPPDGKALQACSKARSSRSNPMDKAKEFYEIVNGMMRYAKEGTEWGRGDVNWVCDSRFGNCTDFHSLFIALARSQKIPARFEIGFGLPREARQRGHRRLSLLGQIQAGRQRLDASRYLRSEQEPEDEGLLLRQPDRGPRDVQHRPRDRRSCPSRTARRSISLSTPTSKWTASRTPPTKSNAVSHSRM